MLKWAHQNGCPWNEKICCVAARHKRLDILLYAIENGCGENRLTHLNAISVFLNGANDNIFPWHYFSYNYEYAIFDFINWICKNGWSNYM